ncbi:hypothetical protein [Clostridium sp. ZBS15]|uniref:hypothetical protein n=1 Tax=Clostridium sp. ZBS15 TaxID=2949969 RepID=UPI002079294B|nr:hypothetical protein [Clostridium sp. ZBS15]
MNIKNNKIIVFIIIIIIAILGLIGYRMSVNSKAVQGMKQLAYYLDFLRYTLFRDTLN